MKSLIEMVIKEHNADNKEGEFKGSVYQEMDWWYYVNENVRFNIHNFGTKSRYRFKVDLYINAYTWLTVKTFDIRDYRKTKRTCKKSKKKK